MTTQASNEKKTGEILWKFFLPIVIIVTLAVGSLFFLKSRLNKGHPSNEQPHETIAKEGAHVPDFTLTRLDGTSTKISNIQGKVLILNFWASWCEACIVEMPSLVRLGNLYRAQGLEILGINLDENPKQVVPGLQAKLGINFPIFVDADGKLAELFDVHGIPLTVVIAPAEGGQKKVLLIQGGERDWTDADIQGRLKEWLNR